MRKYYPLKIFSSWGLLSTTVGRGKIDVAYIEVGLSGTRAHLSFEV